MRVTVGTMMVTAILAAALPASLGAQAPEGKDTARPAIHACALSSSDEVEKVTGRRLVDTPDTTRLGTDGSSCMWGPVQIVLFTGPNSGQRYNALLKNFGKDKEKKEPVSGVGDRAYLMLPTPRDKNEDTIALLVVTAGQNTMAVSVSAEDGKPAESVQLAVMTLAKAALARLR